MSGDRPYAEHGKIFIPATWDSEPAIEYTHDAVLTLIGDLALAWREARTQLAAIAEACAQGHDWNTGYNSPVGDKTTVYHCTREGCQGRKEEPGWLPFEPKQHIVPFSPTLRDCTGPGCGHCADEALADAINRNLADVGQKLTDELLPMLGQRARELNFDFAPKLEVDKIGYTWHVDATPEQVQAALDAREAKPIPNWTGPPIVEDPNLDGGYGVMGDFGAFAKPEPDRPLATGGIVDSSNIHRVGEDRDCGLLPAEPRCICGHTLAYHSDGGCFRHEDDDVCTCVVERSQLLAARERSQGGPTRSMRTWAERDEREVVIPFAPGGPVASPGPFRLDEGEVLIIGYCGCGHHAIHHGNLGCRSNTAAGACPCTTDVAKLATKISGIGTED